MTGLFLAAGGALPAGEWMAGAVLPLLLGWPLFRMRLMGAGDIKLLSALGGLAGGGALLPLLFRIFLCGGALSVLMLLRDGGSFARRSPACCRLPELTASGTGTIHFAVPVLMGCALWMAA
jgi:prepilin peptidase CpaA